MDKRAIIATSEQPAFSLIEIWRKFLPDASITILDNNNLRDYIDVSLYGPELFSGKFSLPQIGDAIRVMLLKEHGGIWLDVDTVILNGSAAEYLRLREDSEVMFFGIPQTRDVHMCLICSRPNSRCMRLWLEYIKDKVRNFNPPARDFWAYFGNSFINVYSKAFPEEIDILDRTEVMPELALLPEYSGYQAYLDFFFLQKKHLSYINSPMLLLHNSWTPEVFRSMDKDQLLACNCTLANVLFEVLELDRSGVKSFSAFHRPSRKIIARLLRKVLGLKPDKFAIRI